MSISNVSYILLFLLVPSLVKQGTWVKQGRWTVIPIGDVLSKCQSIGVDNLFLWQKETEVQADRENEEKEWEAYIVLAGGNIVSSTTADT